MMPYEKIMTFLRAEKRAMLTLLEDMVLIQSGSYNKPGVDRVGRLIQSVFSGHNVSCRVIEQETCGNHLIVRSASDSPSESQVLLVGHMDTVFPKDTAFDWYKEDHANSYGPGVIDMKGGLVTGIFALKALDSVGLLEEVPIAFLINADEEIGSPNSRTLLEREGKRSAFAFVLECGGPGGEVVTGRKGNLSLEIEVEGHAGHAAFAGKQKGSAILELARQIVAIEALNDVEKGVTVNVGKVTGGMGPNTIPEHAQGKIDCRAWRPQDLDRIEAAIIQIATNTKTPNTTCDVKVRSSRPPMPQSSGNRELFDCIQTIADRLGIPIKEERRHGVSDANLIAALGVAVVDGLGPIGGNDHSSEEYLVKESLLKRSTLLACAIVHCWKQQD